MRAPSRRSVLPLLAAGAVGLLIAAGFGVAKIVDRTNALEVPSNAMAPTLGVGARIEVEDLDAGDRPRVGDVVIVNPPRGADPGLSDDPDDDAPACAEPEHLQQGRPCPRARGGRSDAKYVERVVAGPGDTVAYRRGRVIRNGREAREPFVSATCDRSDEAGCDLPRPITLGPDRWFLSGDNRGESNDSRYWGPVPGGWITARVVEVRNPDD